MYLNVCSISRSFLFLPFSPLQLISRIHRFQPDSVSFTLSLFFPLFFFFLFFFFFFFFSRFARRVYIVYVCLILRWTEPLVSSRDPYLIRNSLLQRLLQLSFSWSFPRLFSYPIPDRIVEEEKKKKEKPRDIIIIMNVAKTRRGSCSRTNRGSRFACFVADTQFVRWLQRLRLEK